jgi:hypothetical protein
MGTAIEHEPSGGVPSPSRVLVGGMLGLAVAMGIGRFAFTPILPAMQRDTGLSHLMACVLAGGILTWLDKPEIQTAHP